jgi:hypothetical protein
MTNVTITVDATRALAKLDRVTPAVRNNLRGVIPNLTKQLGALVNSKLDSQLKSRKNIQIKQEMVESASYIYGRVFAAWTGDRKAMMVPQILESGARPHDIEAVNAKALAFFWDRMGGDVFFKRVHHPGFPGIHYMENSFDEMKGEISSRIRSAITAAARDVK